MATDKPKSPSLTEKTLSVRIPETRHRLLKTRCVSEGVSIRSVLLAMVEELEADTEVSKTLLDRASALGGDSH